MPSREARAGGRLAGVVMLLVSLSPSPAALQAASAAGAEDQELFSGFLVPANATDVYAPELSFRVRGWNSNWGRVNLQTLLADGAAVEEGEVVATLEFIGRDALDWINQKVREADASGAEGKVSAAQALEALVMEERRRELNLAQATLELQRESAVSKRQAALLRIQQRLAAFELEAIRARLAAKRQATRSEHLYQDLLIQSARSALGRYAFYERRFTVRAPHRGVVRHAFNPNVGRIIQKGDGVAAGQRLVALARDGVLAARFFVPEHRLRELEVGAKVLVTTSVSAEGLPAKVERIDFFPQELGFLKENPNLPDAQEKAFVVTASLDRAVAGLSAGAEIRVKVRPR